MKKTLKYFMGTVVFALLSVNFYSCDEIEGNLGDDNGNVSKGDTVWIYHIDNPDFRISDRPLALGKDGAVYFEAIPVVPDKKVRVYAINPSGELKWKTGPLSDTQLSGNIVVGDDGTIYCTSGMFLYSINPVDGEINWTWECPKTITIDGVDWNSYGTLRGLALTNSGNVVFQTQGAIAGMVEALFCVDPSGEERWYSLRQNTRANQITVGADGMIYSYGTLFDKKLKNRTDYLIITNPQNGNIEKLIEGCPVNDAVYTTFVGNGDFVEAINDSVICFNKENYSVRWQFPLQGPITFPYCILTDDKGNTFIAPPMYVVGSDETGNLGNMDAVSFPIYGVVENSGNITGGNSSVFEYLKTTDKSGNEMWKNENMYIYSKSILISNNVLYCTDLYNYNFDTGADKLYALRWDASMSKGGWPRISHDNRNTCNFNKW